MYPEIYIMAFYKTGKLAEKSGDRESAQENYQKFLNLLQDADSGLPEVADAKTRLGALR